MKAIKSCYGSVALLKVYCEKCEANSFVLDEKTVCCGKRVKVDAILSERQSSGSYKRKTISLEVKITLVHWQKGKCFYCAEPL
jgi:hypothetical protein